MRPARQAEAKLTTLTKTIEFPFRLSSDLAEFGVAEDMYVRRMDDETKARLLRIESAEYDKNGRLSTFTGLSGCLFSETISPSLDINDEFCSSNYVLIAPSVERAAEFNLALKLTGDSCSSLYIGYEPTGALHFLAPPCYFGRSVLDVTQAEVHDLSKLVAQIAKGRGDKKLRTMSDIYVHALSPDLRDESRFIEIAVILEMLLLPDRSTDLAYRFSLRLAKLMGKLFDESITGVFEHGRRIYKIRSKLVHAGSDRDLESVAPIAYNYARTLLAAYLDDKTLFQQAALDALCLS